MNALPRPENNPVRFEDTMLRRIETLGREGRVKTLEAYTGAYYPDDVRRAAIRAIGAVASWEAGTALLRQMLYAEGRFQSDVRESIFRWCDAMDVGPLSAALLFSRVGQAARLCRVHDTEQR